MEYSNLTFRFILPECADETKDHLLSVKRKTDHYVWSFCEEKRNKRQEMYLQDAAAVLGNLQRMFHMLSWDEDPYELIQVIAPGYPMIMLKVADIKDSWPTLREFLEGVFENWPVNREVQAKEQAAPPCGFDGCPCECLEQEETEEEYEESDSEDDDKTDPNMPALISQEDNRIADILLQMLREPAPTSPPAARRRLEPEFVSESDLDSEEGWLDEAERREPIEIRRVVNTPNGPRTHIRFV